MHIWVDKFRNEISVSNMRSSHIKNCIKAFESGIIPNSYHGGKDKWIKIFNEELSNRRNKKISIILE